jgi:hypothetical protein
MFREMDHKGLPVIGAELERVPIVSLSTDCARRDRARTAKLAHKGGGQDNPPL